MSKKLLALLLAMIMIVGSFTSVLAETTPTDKKEETKSEEVKTEEKKDEKSEEKKDEKSEEKTEEKTEEKVEEPKDELLAEAMKMLKDAGFIEGFTAGGDDFKVEQNITRAQFSAMLVRGLGLKDSAEALKAAPPQFTDVNYTHWANGYVAAAKATGIINGYPNGQFRPENQITYAEMAAMLVRVLKLEKPGFMYPSSHIMAAQQAGLFKGVTVARYDAPATRGDVFKMFYNTVTNKEFGQRKILKAIVLENKRVENLDKNQITVEVLDVVQKANWVRENRADDKKGDQHKYTLAEDVKADPEELLGKVVNITVDKNDKVLNVEIDKSFDYIEGSIEDVKAKTFQVDGVKYTVIQDERYDKDDERIYRTYLNNKAYKYADFARDFKEGAYDYARFTVKNAKVVFIDAYKFYDIAPVAEVKEDKVFYYDDARSARITQAASLNGDITFVSGGIYSLGEKKNIVKDDVLHFYKNDRTNKNSAIVKKNAAVQTKLVKTHTDRWGNDWIVGEKEEYYINPDEPFRLISSYEGKHFDVVTSRHDLRKLVGENVKIVVAIDGSAQLIQSEKAWKDGIHAVKKITSSGEVQLLPPREDIFWATETRDTDYIAIRKIVNNNRLHDFEYDDIVYYEGTEKNEISQMGLVLPKKNQYTDNDKLVKGYADNFQKAAITGRYITCGTKDYRYFENLNAYYVDKFGNLQQIKDFEAFVKDQKNNVKLEAFVMSEGELKETLEGLDLELYNFLSQSKEIASIVVFNNAVAKIGVDTVYAEVADMWAKYTYSKTTDVRFVDAEGKVYDVEIDGRFGTMDFKKKDIVELNLDKKSLETEQLKGYVGKVVIKAEDPYKTIKTLRPRETYSINGEEKYFSKKTQIFNKEFGDLAQVAYEEDDNKFVLVIRYNTVNAMADRDILDPASDANNIVLRDKDGKQRAYKVTRDTEFRDEKDEIIGFGTNYAPTFETMFAMGEVEVTSDRDGRVALVVKGLRKAAKMISDDLDAAKKAVEKLGAKKYEFGSDEAANKAAFKAEAEDAIKEAGLAGKVEVDTVTVNGNTNMLETVIKSKVDATKTTTAKNAYAVKSEKEDNQEKANMIKKLANNGKVTLKNTFEESAAKQAIVDYINAKLTLADKDADKIADTNITNLKKVDDTAYTVEVTVGTAPNEGKVELTFDVIIEK